MIGGSWRLLPNRSRVVLQAPGIMIVTKLQWSCHCKEFTTMRHGALIKNLIELTSALLKNTVLDSTITCKTLWKVQGKWPPDLSHYSPKVSMPAPQK